MKKEFIDAIASKLSGRSLVVASAREPYAHSYEGDEIVLKKNSGGVVTALDPLMKALKGSWVAFGSGEADREAVNAKNEFKVETREGGYTLKRVFLEKGLEDGFLNACNGAIWPLSHMVFIRPAFVDEEWEAYKQANRQMASAIAEVCGDDDVVWINDYQLALVAGFLKKLKPKVTTAFFWHIPWPNPEAFGICPWHPDLLRGMLGADLIGFHTQYHCNNFLESCNRYLEARVDMETFSVTMGDHQTSVRAFPIGIETSAINSLSDPQRETLKAEYGIHSEFVAIGVDRVDYTKGLIERLFGVERFLEKNPEYIGRFCLTQIGSPSRSNIPAYKALVQEINGQVARINARFSTTPQAQAAHPKYKPIVFLYKHHDWHEIQRFYQLGDICLVTSLHDGMNLVAKEYIWCQRPDRGALILSRFTGASRELSEAFLVNPYCIEEIADAILGAIVMPTEEKHRRMATMRRKVEDHNAYHWASDLIAALLPKGEKHVTRFKAHPM